MFVRLRIFKETFFRLFHVGRKDDRLTALRKRKAQHVQKGPALSEEGLQILKEMFDTNNLPKDWDKTLADQIRLPKDSPVGPVPDRNDFVKQRKNFDFYLPQGW